MSVACPAPRTSTRRSVGVAIAAAVAVLLGACGGSPDILSPGERAGAAAEQPQGGEAGGDTTAEAPTPTVVPTPAPLVVSVEDVTATVGEPAAIVIDVSDAGGDVEVVATEFVGEPPGVVDGTWIPETAGTWDATILVTDDLGRIGEHPVRFSARHPASPDTLVAIGDSVASGHGLQARDYLGGDPCFRSDDGYPNLVAQGLIERGVFAETGAAVVVACSGAGVADVTTALVTGGSPDWAPPGIGALTQIDWAVRANPAVVTVTVGINDIGFVEPAGLIVDGRLDEEVFDARVSAMADGLGAIVARLVGETDADIVVTGYYNPAAARPQGIEGCELECFRTVAGQAVERVDGAILTALPDDPRVRFVSLAERFADHGAPNGLGLDSARAGEGVLGELFGGPFVGTQAYCARGETVGESWINALDCVHPDDEGHRQIAAAVLEAL
ncbi:MAG: GDSL-type esterase/lipase family protein [Acidimicrobiales bacterium]